MLYIVVSSRFHTMTSMSDLHLLGELILQSIQTIESRLESENLQFPALKEPLDNTCKVESVLLEAEISTARSHIVAAASQLIAMVRSPVETMIENGLLVSFSRCISTSRMTFV